MLTNNLSSGLSHKNGVFGNFEVLCHEETSSDKTQLNCLKFSVFTMYVSVLHAGVNHSMDFNGDTKLCLFITLELENDFLNHWSNI